MEPEEDLVSELARRAEVDSLCARVLANRGRRTHDVVEIHDYIFATNTGTYARVKI